MFSDLESLAGDFVNSQQFNFYTSEASKIKEHAADILGSFINGCRERGVTAPDLFTIVCLEDVLMNHMARLALPLAVRQEVPELLRSFFEYCAQSGTYPPARLWVGWVASLEGRYREKFRDDGSVKGETFKKNYTDVNRNDPCPCGSGKKFKKCCMKIIL
jgi:hypothetical protein